MKIENTITTGTILAICVPLAALFIRFVYKYYLSSLGDREDSAFKNLKASVDQGTVLADLYQSRLKNLLNWADNFFHHDSIKRIFDGDFIIKNRSIPSVWSGYSFDRCLLLALSYPILSAILAWTLFGDAGDLGAVFGLTPNDSLWQRLLISIFFPPLVLLFVQWIKSQGRWLWIVLTFTMHLLLVSSVEIFSYFGVFVDLPQVFAGDFVIVFAIAISIACIFTGIVAVAIAYAIVFFIGVAAPGFNASLVVVIFCSVLAFAIAFVVAIFQKRAIKKHQFFWFNSISYCFYFSASIALIWHVAGPDMSSNAIALLVAFVFIPLVNVPFDWFSIGLTRYLLRLNLGANGFWRLLYSLGDLLGAIISLLVLSIAMITLFEIIDAIGRFKGVTEPIIRIKSTLDDMAQNGVAGRHFWIYFALFSTLIPTFIHVLVWISSWLAATEFPPKKFAYYSLARTDEGGTQLAASWFTLRALVSFVITLILTAILIWFLLNISFFGSNYLELIILYHQFVAGWFG